MAGDLQVFNAALLSEVDVVPEDQVIPNIADVYVTSMDDGSKWVYCCLDNGHNAFDQGGGGNPARNGEIG